MSYMHPIQRKHLSAWCSSAGAGSSRLQQSHYGTGCCSRFAISRRMPGRYLR